MRGRLVDWLPTYGNVEALLVQICAFLAHSNARVASLAAKGGGGTAAAGGAAAAADGESPAVPANDDDDEAQRKKAQRAYDNLKAFHAKKGWSAPAANVS